MSVRYPIPEILQRIHHTQSAVIEASAGTGKTYTIQHLIVQLLLNHDLDPACRIDEILVVTFTEKATAELRQRVREILEKMLAYEGEADGDGTQKDAHYWVIDDQARRRIRQALFAFDSAVISTIHGFCRKLLAEQAFHHGALFQLELTDGERAFDQAFRRTLREFSHDDAFRAALLERYLGSEDADVDTLRRALRTLHKTGAPVHPRWERERVEPLLQEGKGKGDWDEVLRDEGLSVFSVLVQELFTELSIRVREEKRSKGLLDFDDMLVRLHDALHGPHNEPLLSALRKKYRFAIVDEFQDTDPIQWAIFRKIFGESGSRNPLYIIGDPKQSIYSFRGADIHAYLDAKEHVRNGGGEVHPLPTNYRSAPALVEGYNYLLTEGGNLLLSADSIKRSEAEKKRRKWKDGEFSCAAIGALGDDPFFSGGINYSQPVTAARTDLKLFEGTQCEEATPGIRVLHFEPADEEKQYADPLRAAYGRRIAQEISDLLSSPDRKITIEERGETRPLEPDDIFILVRQNKDAKEVAGYLREAGVPHAIYKQDGLYQTPEARHIRDVLLAVADPQDAGKRVRALTTPFFHVPWKEAVKCRNLPEHHVILQRIEHWNRLAKERRYDSLFDSLLDDSGLARRELFFKENEREFTNYKHIFELLLEEAHARRPTLDELVTYLMDCIDKRTEQAEDGNVQRLESERRSVQIMTMHKSKGLEAPVVFLYTGIGSNRSRHNDAQVYYDPQTKERRIHIDGGLDKKAAGEIQKLAAQEEENENQRLLYVAITRPQLLLYLPYFGHRYNCQAMYRPLDDRLHAMRCNEVEHDSFRWIRFDGATLSKPEQTKAAGRWMPPAPPAPPPSLLDLPAGKTGYRVLSFTSVRDIDKRRDNEAPSGGGADEVHVRDFAPSPDELPSSVDTGIFLHQVLEEIDRSGAEGFSDAASWLAKRPEASRIFERNFTRFGIPENRRDHARRLVFHALTAPLSLVDEHGGQTALPPVCRADHYVTEPEFYYPLPADASVPFGRYGPCPAGDGFVHGFIDLLFSSGGKLYVADWKSNRREDYRPPALRRYVNDAYLWQVKLYALAAVQLFGLDQETYDEKFGGVLYLFLRGMNREGDGSAGVYFNRPSWKEITKWREEALALPSRLAERERGPGGDR